LFVANVVTYEFLASTLNFSLFLLAEALDRNLDTALIALPLVTLPLTLMLHAVE
jgi:malonyl CoA-acyl carrier protein transacylase